MARLRPQAAPAGSDEALFAALENLGGHTRVCAHQPQGFVTACRNAWLYLSGSITGNPPAPDPYIAPDERRQLQAVAARPASERIGVLIEFAIGRGASELAVRSVVQQRRARLSGGRVVPMRRDVRRQMLSTTTGEPR